MQALLDERRQTASARIDNEAPRAWRKAQERWEKQDQTSWSFGDIPSQVLVTEKAGVPLLAYPGIKAGVAGVSLRLFKTEEEAQQATRRGLTALLELQLRHDLGWLQRDLKSLRSLGTLTATLVPMPELQKQANEMLHRWVCDPERVLTQIKPPSAQSRAAAESRPCLCAQHFETALAKSQSDLRGIVPRLGDALKEVLILRQELLVHPTPYEKMAEDLERLLPKDFLKQVSYPRLAHLPRYLKAMQQRAERSRQNATKDQERARQLAPYVKAVEACREQPGGERLRWLVEEFRVSLFAQELGTAEPVSAKKLDRVWKEVRDGSGDRTIVEDAKPKPMKATPVATPQKAPLKNLNALDKLFRRS